MKWFNFAANQTASFLLVKPLTFFMHLERKPVQIYVITARVMTSWLATVFDMHFRQDTDEC